MNMNILEGATAVLKGNPQLIENQDQIAKYSKAFEEHDIKLYGKNGKFYLSFLTHDKQRMDIPFSLSWASNSFLRDALAKVESKL
jgi:hypothetical protein